MDQDERDPAPPPFTLDYRRDPPKPDIVLRTIWATFALLSGLMAVCLTVTGIFVAREESIAVALVLVALAFGCAYSAHYLLRQ